MRESGNAQAKPYHHGDLSRALVDAALRLIERDGPAALSLRAVAREAGVSPAAPYHHFADKSELLDAVAHQGWEVLNGQMRTALSEARTPGQKRTAMGVAYVRFAREHASLYRVMGDCSRDTKSVKMMADNDEGTGFSFVRDTIRASAGNHASALDVELATIAAWCAAHGLSEIAGYRQFDRLKEELGGEEAFVQAVLEHIGMFQRTHAEP
jgi:AcrR family transcriptional regulator